MNREQVTFGERLHGRVDRVSGRRSASSGDEGNQPRSVEVAADTGVGEDAAHQIAGDVRSSRLPDVEEPNAEAVPRAQQRLLFRIPERKRVLAAQVLEKVAVPAREGGGDDRKIRGVRRQLQHVD